MRLSPQSAPVLYTVRSLLDAPPDWDDDGALAPDAVSALRETASWISTHLSNPHENLGRKGPVCPATVPSVARDLMWLVPMSVGGRDRTSVEADLLTLKRAWLDARPTSGGDRSLKAIVIVMLDIPRDSHRTVTLELQRRMKPRFLEDGMMLGEFFPECEAPGLRSETFRPLRSERPLLVIRDMVQLDIAFLAREESHACEYARKFGAEPPTRVVEQIGSIEGRISEPYALAVLGWMRRHREAKKDRTVDPLTGLANGTGLDDQLGELWRLCPHAAQSATVITIQTNNAAQLVRERGHAVFELALFRLSHLVAAAVGDGWTVARTGYGELTLWAPGKERPEAMDLMEGLRGTLEERATGLLGHEGWIPRFGIGARLPGRGRPGARTGADGNAAVRARDLFDRARVRSAPDGGIRSSSEWAQQEHSA